MNKFLIFMVALCNIASLGAMEKEQTFLPIIKQENDFFGICIRTSVQCSKKDVADNKIPSNNPIHIMTLRCAQYFKSAGNDLPKMIKNQDLEGRIEEFKKFESDKTVRQLKNNLNTEYGRCYDASKESLHARRKELAEIDLKTKQPTYYKSFTDHNRVTFMLDNVFFSTGEAAEKDYIAMFIYDNVLAHRETPYDDSK